MLSKIVQKKTACARKKRQCPGIVRPRACRLASCATLKKAPAKKCAAIVGETMKRYHPHGDAAIYPTLVRMGQDWNMRHRLVQPQGNFGSVAGLPPAHMRYTEAKLSPIAAEMLEDLERDTV